MVWGIDYSLNVPRGRGVRYEPAGARCTWPPHRGSKPQISDQLLTIDPFRRTNSNNGGGGGLSSS